MAKKLLTHLSLKGDLIDLVNSSFEEETENILSPENAISISGQSSSKELEASHLPVGDNGKSSVTAALKEEKRLPEEETTSLLEETEPREKEDALKAVRDGMFHIFKLGEVSYRVGGVKPLFVTSLRVNIKAEKENVSCYESLDLYSSRARISFCSLMQRQLLVEPARVEKDLITILKYLEEERDKSLTTKDEEKKELTEEEIRLGLSYLKDPNIFKRIVDDLSTLGYVGEELNKMLLYLCASSRKLDDPISILMLSQSASGKSYLVECVRKLMPPEEVVAVTSLSEQALNYIEDLKHKFLILGEAVHGEVIEHQIREMLSGKELSRLVTIKDAETGKLESKVVRRPVIVSSVMGSTNYHVNPENASRCFVINADESESQTRLIHEKQKEKYTLKKLKEKEEEKNIIIKTHHAAQRLLRKVNIVNEFAQVIDFPVTQMRTRRDHERFLDLIACICYLRQYQKKEESEGDLKFIKCDLSDYEEAYKIMTLTILKNQSELTEGAKLLYGKIKKYCKKESLKQKVGVEEISFTQRDVREESGFGNTFVRLNIKLLLEYEYLESLKGGRERSKGYYRLSKDEEVGKETLDVIPTPLSMKEKINISLKKRETA